MSAVIVGSYTENYRRQTKGGGFEVIKRLIHVGRDHKIVLAQVRKAKQRMTGRYVSP